MGMEINSLWLTMMLIKIHFQRSRGVERAITTAALSTFFFFFFFRWDESRAARLLWLLRWSRKGDQEDGPQHHPMPGWCQVTSDRVWAPPVPLCSPVCSEPGSIQTGAQERAPTLWVGKRFFWKVFSEASSSSLYMQVLCLIIASISWQIYCLTANSPSLLYHR